MGGFPEQREKPEIPTGGSYFARHWRGDLSLARSWWLNGVLLFGFGCNFIFLIAVLASIAAFKDTPVLAVTVAVGEVALSVVAYIWALVGTWRSASKYQGPRVWSILAKIGMSLGVLVSIANLGHTLTAIGTVLNQR